LLNYGDKAALRKAINLHYVNEEECNELDCAGNIHPKYPEKETQDMRDAHSNVYCDVKVRLSVGFNELGLPEKIEIIE